MTISVLPNSTSHWKGKGTTVTSSPRGQSERHSSQDSLGGEMGNTERLKGVPKPRGFPKIKQVKAQFSPRTGAQWAYKFPSGEKPGLLLVVYWWPAHSLSPGSRRSSPATCRGTAQCFHNVKSASSVKESPLRSDGILTIGIISQELPKLKHTWASQDRWKRRDMPTTSVQQRTGS